MPGSTRCRGSTPTVTLMPPSSTPTATRCGSARAPPGVTIGVLPAVQVAHFERVRELAHRHGLAYALGIHPLCVGRGRRRTTSTCCATRWRVTRDDPRLVAVGEIGLDWFVPGLDRDKQERFYIAQLKLARDAGLPAILHVRRSADGLLAGLRRIEMAGGIAHAFNGSAQQAQAFVERGWRLGFGGAMTFERARQIRELAATLPETVPVLETDAPDIPPQWLYRNAEQRARGEVARNEPAELPRIAQTLAQLRGWSLEQTAARTAANACAALPRLQALLEPALSARAAAATPRLRGLAPVVAADTRLLVLGSFPSEASLARGAVLRAPAQSVLDDPVDAVERRPARAVVRRRGWPRCAAAAWASGTSTPVAAAKAASTARSRRPCPTTWRRWWPRCRAARDRAQRRRVGARDGSWTRAPGQRGRAAALEQPGQCQLVAGAQGGRLARGVLAPRTTSWTLGAARHDRSTRCRAARGHDLRDRWRALPAPGHAVGAGRDADPSAAHGGAGVRAAHAGLDAVASPRGAGPVAMPCNSASARRRSPASRTARCTCAPRRSS